jgi:hypothetical protein
VKWIGDKLNSIAGLSGTPCVSVQMRRWRWQYIVYLRSTNRFEDNFCTEFYRIKSKYHRFVLGLHPAHMQHD